MRIFTNLLAGFLLLSVSNHLVAQYSTTPSSFSEVFLNEDISDTQSTYFSYVSTMNNSGTTELSIDWEVIFTDFPSSWRLQISDANNNYIDGITNSIQPIVLAPESNDASFVPHIFPEGEPDCGAFWVIITDHNTGEILDTIEYEIKINVEECIPSVTNFIANNKYQITPNPTNNQLTINGLSRVVELQIIDANGQLVQHYQQLNSATIDLAFLPTGIYFLKIIEKSKAVYLHKIVKL